MLGTDIHCPACFRKGSDQTQAPLQALDNKHSCLDQGWHRQYWRTYQENVCQLWEIASSKSQIKLVNYHIKLHTTQPHTLVSSKGTTSIYKHLHSFFLLPTPFNSGYVQCIMGYFLTSTWGMVTVTLDLIPTHSEDNKRKLGLTKDHKI